MQPYSSIAELTLTLGQKMKRQLEEIGRVSRLKRYLSPQVAETILKRDDGDLFVSHRREIEAWVEAEPIGELKLRGFIRPVSVFNIKKLNGEKADL